MALGTQISQLWKRSRPFRFTTFAAGVMTVLALVSGGGGGGGSTTAPTQQTNTSQGGQTANTTGGGTQATNPAPQQQAMVQCGPAGATQLAAPLVVGNAQPRNVTAVAPTANQNQGGVPLEVVGRFNQFFVTVDAAKSEPRRGESCALMSDAITLLQASDYAYASCFQDGQPKLTDALACSQTHAQSEGRYDSLVAAYDAFKDEPSSVNIAALAQAQSDMKDYDKARERWREMAPIVTEANAASASIVESDMRIGRLVAAANAAESGDAAAIETLAEAAALDQLDIARLSSEQAEMLEAARQARSDVQDSDARLDRLAVAVGSVAGGGTEARAELIASVGSLTAFDLARATPEQSQSIAKAKSEAAGFALDDLVAEAGGIQLATATPEQHQRLVDLAKVVNDHGGVTTPTPQQTAALDLARDAASALARSDRRLEAMSTTTAAVRAGGPSAMGDDVLKSHDAITDFDLRRMDDDQKADFAVLGKAREVTTATAARELTRTVPLYLSAEGEGPTDQALRALQDGLKRDGFNIVETAEASAVHFTLRVGELAVSENTFGNTTVKTARIEIGLGGAWTIADEDILNTSAEGIGRGRSSENKALDEAIGQLLSAISDAASGT